MKIGSKVIVNFDIVNNEMEPSTFNLIVPYLNQVGEVIEYGDNYVTVRFGNIGEFWFEKEELIAV